MAEASPSFILGSCSCLWCCWCWASPWSGQALHPQLPWQLAARVNRMPVSCLFIHDKQPRVNQYDWLLGLCASFFFLSQLFLWLFFSFIFFLCVFVLFSLFIFFFVLFPFVFIFFPPQVVACVVCKGCWVKSLGLMRFQYLFVFLKKPEKAETPQSSIVLVAAMTTIEYCCISSLFGIFLETNIKI